MLYRHQPDPLQLRHRCRNPRCTGKLKLPADNPRDAFCCRGCERQFYGRRCRVCGALFSPKTGRRVVCSRAKCQSAFRRHPEDFFGVRYPNRGVTAQRRKKRPFYAPCTGTKPGRAFALSPVPRLIRSTLETGPSCQSPARF